MARAAMQWAGAAISRGALPPLTIRRKRRLFFCRFGGGGGEMSFLYKERTKEIPIKRHGCTPMPFGIKFFWFFSYKKRTKIEKKKYVICGTMENPAGSRPRRVFCCPQGAGLQEGSHPSVCLRQTPPLRVEAFTLLPVKGSPLRGCGVERRLRRIQRDEAGAAVAECKRRSKARSMMRQPQPGKAAQRPEGSSSPAVRHLPGSSRGGVKTPPYKPTQTAYFYDTRFGRL